MNVPSAFIICKVEGNKEAAKKSGAASLQKFFRALELLDEQSFH
jgi:hypothetical protein